MQNETEVHVYEALRGGLPPLGKYFRDVRSRFPFMWAKAKSDMRSQHLDTVLGQIWTVLNPLLLGLVYALLISVLVGRSLDLDTLAKVLAGLFAFFYTRGVVGGGASIIVRSGSAIMNSNFPRITLPISNLMLATIVYLPSLLVYGVFHVAAGFPLNWNTLWLVPLIVIHGVLNFGIGLFFTTSTVFFRDTASFLPYLLRIWMYVSPVLFRLDDVPDQFRTLILWNPLTPFFAAWGQILFDGTAPAPEFVFGAIAWAVAATFLGGWFFILKERAFAFRI